MVTKTTNKKSPVTQQDLFYYKYVAPLPLSRFKDYEYTSKSPVMLRKNKQNASDEYADLTNRSTFKLSEFDADYPEHRMLIVDDFDENVQFMINAELANKILKSSKPVIIKQSEFVVEQAEEDTFPAKSEQFEKLYIKTFSKMKWQADKNMVKWLRQFKDIVKLADDEKYTAALDKALIWITKKPDTQNIAEPCANKKAVSASNAILKDSVPKLINNALNWCELLGADLSMVGLNIADAADHLDVACALREGNLKRVEKISRLDTASRDYMPDDSWDFIQEYCR